MSVMPKLSKARSIACAAVFGMGLLLLPTATARVVEDSSSDTSAKVKAQAGSAKVLDQGGVADSSLFPSVGAESALQFVDVMASGGNIQLNTACAGITPSNEYFGLWKPLGSNKAKCKEGATGSPRATITRLTCRIVTLNDGNFDNAVVSGSDHCVK